MTYKVYDDYMVTILPDGAELVATLAEQPGQADTAEMLRCSVREMNETHDPFHNIVADALGLRCSPALWAASRSAPWDELYDLEEEAILALQKFWFDAKRKGWVL